MASALGGRCSSLADSVRGRRPPAKFAYAQFRSIGDTRVTPAWLPGRGPPSRNRGIQARTLATAGNEDSRRSS